MLRPLILAACIFFIIRYIKKHLQSFPPAQAHHVRNPYQILGIQKDASAERIKQAYRDKLSQNHPDKVAHLSEDIQTTARKKTDDIQWAYEQLK